MSPQHRLAFPQPLNRAAVARAMEVWPGDSHDTPDVRRAMSTYTVSLGVGCQYCHTPANWKGETAVMKSESWSLARGRTTAHARCC